MKTKKQPTKKKNLKQKAKSKKIRFKFGSAEIVMSNSGDNYPYRVTYEIHPICAADATVADSLRGIARVLIQEIRSMHSRIEELENQK
jgi:hypothetical protein